MYGAESFYRTWSKKLAALWRSKIRYRVHMSPRLVCILSRINRTLARPAYTFRTHCNLSVYIYSSIHLSNHPSVPLSIWFIYLSVRLYCLIYTLVFQVASLHQVSQRTLCMHSAFRHACHMPDPSRPPCAILWRIYLNYEARTCAVFPRIMPLPFPYIQITFSTHFSNIHSRCFSPNMRARFTPIQNNRQNYGCVYFSLLSQAT
jgi:hypothetical protein